MKSHNDFKKIFECSKKLTKQKKNIKIKINSYDFIKYLIKNNIFFLYKYFYNSNK